MKKENFKLIMGILISLLIIAIGTVAFADVPPKVIIGGGSSNTQNVANNSVVNKAVNKVNKVNIVTNTSYKTNTEVLPQTGENDVYIVSALGIVCLVSAVYAYSKIRKY